MLVEIRCDSFANKHRTVTFGGGLNTVLGSNDGSNAIGKSTFLWIIDYAFGGTIYNDIWKDIARYIGKDPVRFTFQFGGQLHYFFRTLEEPRTVNRCDKSGKIIEKLTLDKFRKWLFESYDIPSEGISFQDLTNRFNRIYGADNTYEKTPYLQKPRESEDKAVDFLIRLNGGNEILEKIAAAETRIGVKASEFVEKKPRPVDTSKIEGNNATIASLKIRLEKLMKQEEDAQLAFFGFDTETFERMSRLRGELKILVRKRNRLKSQLNAISEVEPYAEGSIRSEFNELKTFFPDVNIKSLEEIEGFHKKIRSIIGDEASREISRLSAVISQCDAEIAALRSNIEGSGLAKEMSSRALSQCVSVSRKIDALTEENEELLRQAEIQDARAKAETEETVLCYAQAQIDEMGLTDEVKLLGARVYGSRTRTSLAKDGSDLDVVISYTGDIQEDEFSNALQEGGLEIACLPVDMNPISLEKTGTLEAFMAEAETYLDGKEAEKLAADMVTFSYYHDTYNYLDTSDDREGQIRGIAHDISGGNISGMEDWMQAVIRESRDPKETIEAKELLQRLIDRTDGQRYTACETTDAYEEPFTVFDRVNADYYQDKDGFTPLFVTEQEAQERASEINAAFQAEREAQIGPEPKISFYVAECMEYPVIGEYHNNLTLQEAVDIYNQIPAERINGIKGVGFCLEDGSMYDGEIGLMSAGVIDKEFVNSIPHYKESPLVQKAIADLEAILEKEKGLEPVKNVQEQAEEAKDSPVSGNLHEAAAEPGKPQKTAPETDRGKEKGVGRKQSVLQALRERQAKLKAQENQKPEKEPKAHKKGEQEL